MRIGLLSDTHGFLDQAILEFFADRDEIWHAGDFGTTEVLDGLSAIKPVAACTATSTVPRSASGYRVNSIGAWTVCAFT